MDVDYYITPEEYLKAEKNGIGRRLFEDRVRRYGWSKTRALATPKTIREESPFTKEQLNTARKNGISFEAAYGRVKRLKWSIEKAISTPILTRSEMASNRKKEASEAMKVAVRNGISEQLFRERIAREWSEEEASTIPPLKRGQRRNGVAKNAKESSR
ncbi:hypothetical protein [Clostridium cellulovorans]|uniref:Uncharacterized protein n=1 Tax=Clostridium cellulovorans (strain ATCC 35296 / DSM 3052 / OCM 3 / 743B) TaxID=573061 RepID=D9SWG3_CLOC7|nr:hypothetical protein [Clostridium cellulovorans]ADL53245.1 hypothetical protein Clocel_3570 [Clostridium cellulovorans 743B]